MSTDADEDFTDAELPGMKEEQEAKGCPDGGACHHQCPETCFRVKYCGPLSGVYPDDNWPPEIAEAARTGRAGHL